MNYGKLKRLGLEKAERIFRKVLQTRIHRLMLKVVEIIGLRTLQRNRIYNDGSF